MKSQMKVRKTAHINRFLRDKLQFDILFLMLILLFPRRYSNMDSSSG